MVASIKNQYVGINAHLNSILQHHEGLWEEFHTDHLSDVRIHLTRQLLGTNYVAELEKGIQIQRLNEPPEFFKSDVLVTSTMQGTFSPSPLASSPSYKVLNLINGVPELELYEEDDYFQAVHIYRANRQDEGNPVAWIELLSPSNKKKGRHHSEYVRKRAELLATESCVFVEIDYLHQSPPTIIGVADYSEGEPDAKAYRVSVLDSRPNKTQGYILEIDFGVEEEIPTVPIPLLDQDIVQMELNAVYYTTYERALYGIDPKTQVNYRVFPANFQNYTLADQQKITKRMLTVIDAAQNGIDLEGDTVPFPINENLDPAMLKNS